MAFKEIRIMDIWEIIRRYQSGHSIKSIARSLGYDRKTVRRYLHYLRTKGISLEPGSLPVINDDEKILSVLREIVSENRRRANAQAVLEPYRDELISLVTKDELKPKSAFSVLCQRHEGLSDTVSYTSFKRFTRRHKLALKVQEVTCRIEVEPGSQLQIDYGKVGRLFDPSMNTLRTLYAFIATLSYSRHKYAEFTFSQNQQSFVNSHVRAFSFFGGVATSVVLDNLKAGVISPSLYDPKFNRTYDEMAKHYGCFLDPARPGKPQDKGKVESDVKTIREKYKELRVLNPSASVQELNEKILHWLCEGYGMRVHGTTQRKPYAVFLQEEKHQLLLLPDEPFEVAFWKEAAVHPDCYIQVQKKSYSVPYAFVGKKVWAKISHNTVQVYCDEQLIKQHVIPKKGYRQTDIKDFPENLQLAIDRGLPKHLQNEAAKIGPQFAQLVRDILSPHAFMNLRRAQGLLSVAKGYPPELLERAAHGIGSPPGSYLTPKYFKTFVDKLRYIDQAEREEQSLILPLSSETATFIRPTNYFNHSHQEEEGNHYGTQSRTAPEPA